MFSFILPNRNKIDSNGLIDVLGSGSTSECYFLDSETGEIGCCDLFTDKEKNSLGFSVIEKTPIELEKVFLNQKINRNDVCYCGSGKNTRNVMDYNYFFFLSLL